MSGRLNRGSAAAGQGKECVWNSVCLCMRGVGWERGGEGTGKSGTAGLWIWTPDLGLILHPVPNNRMKSVGLLLIGLPPSR